MKTEVDALENVVPPISGHGSEKTTFPNSFLAFARIAERVCAATKRVEKSECVASYFDTLGDEDLIPASRFLSGQIFPLQEHRSLSVGPSTLIAAIASLMGIDAKAVRSRSILAGDLGTVARDLFERDEGQSDKQDQLTLQNVQKTLDKISCTAGTKQKTDRVKDLLRQATPLEAKYLVKMIAGDMHIGLQEGTVEDAIARLTGNEVARVQRANMLTGDIGFTAILARKGQLDAARLSLFHPIKSMLAMAIDLVEAPRYVPERFIVEDKFDGVRVQAHIGLDLPDLRDAPGAVHQGIRVALFSRNLEDITKSFSDLVPALTGLLPASAGAVAANGLILDGEIIPISQGRALRASVLVPLMADNSPDASVAPDVYTAFIAFDILSRDGKALIQEPLTTRAAAMEDLFYDKNRTWRASQRAFVDPKDLVAELQAAQARGSEGIVLKDPRSTYRPGRRSNRWLKIKQALATLDVVVTAAEAVKGARAKRLSDYTFAVRASQDDFRLLEIGKTSIGLEDQDTVRLDDWFRGNTIQQYAQGNVRRVLPQIVLEVTFSKVKPSARYESGYALVLPRILRIRHDKPVEEIDTLETVRQLAGDGEEDPSETSAF